MMIDGHMPSQTGDAASSKPVAALASLFLPSVTLGESGRPSVSVDRARVVVETLSPGVFEPSGLHRDGVPRLVVPPGELLTSGGRRVVVAVEGHDVSIAQQLISLLNPSSIEIDVVHVTWLPGTVSPPIDESGLDNPVASDLLLYHGAREALVDRPAELRAAGFFVSTHLRMHRHPSTEIATYLSRRPAALMVLGLGRHGAGIGKDLLQHVRPAPAILYLHARG